MSPPLLPATPISSTWMNWRPRGPHPQELDGARWPDPDRVDYDHLAQTRIPCCGRPGNAPKPPTSSLTPQTCPGWRITAPSPPSTTGIKPLSGSGLRTPLRRSRRRLIFTVPPQETFYRQWMALKKYASRRCIRIMGDIPSTSPQTAFRCGASLSSFSWMEGPSGRLGRRSPRRIFF